MNYDYSTYQSCLSGGFNSSKEDPIQITVEPSVEEIEKVEEIIEKIKVEQPEQEIIEIKAPEITE